MSLSADPIIKSIAYMDPNLLKREPELVTVKWPAYRALTPFECDHLFARTYRKCYRDMIRTRVDYLLAESVKGIDLRFWTSPELLEPDSAGVRLTVHQARQCADECGMPYEDFISFCMTFASNRSCKNFPRPNQLIPKNPDTLSLSEKRFERSRRNIWNKFWSDFRKFREMRLETKMNRYTAENPNPPQIVPGCLGVLPEGKQVDVNCMHCKQKDGCLRVAALVNTVVERMVVAGEPTWKVREDSRRARARQASRDRQRRCRARKSAMTAADSHLIC